MRVLYSGHTIRTMDGSLDWIPLSEVVERLKLHVPDDIITACNA